MGNLSKNPYIFIQWTILYNLSCLLPDLRVPGEGIKLLNNILISNFSSTYHLNVQSIGQYPKLTKSKTKKKQKKTHNKKNNNNNNPIKSI